MLGSASLSTLPSLYKILFYTRFASIYFEVERILQSQTFLLNMLKQRCIRKIRSTFRHSEDLEGELQVQIENPLSDLFGRLVLAALKEGIRLVCPLLLSPLTSNSSAHHYNEAAVKCLLILPLLKPCSFTVYPQGD